MPETAKRTARVPILGENGRISDDYIPESIPQAVTAAEQAAESAASSANQALQQATAAEKAASSATGSVEQAKTYANNASTYMSTAESHAESAATDAQAASGSASAAASSAAAAEVSNQSAAQSSADAMGFRNSAVQYRDQAREAAQEAQGYVTTVQQLEQNATNSATAAQNSATSAAASAETATAAASHASTSATNAVASAQIASDKADSVLDHYIESATATTLEPGQQATATVADKVLQLGIPKGDKGDPGDVSAVQTAEGSDLSVSTEAGTVTIDDSALRARISELENQAANVVTGESTGLVAHGEDAYAQKPIETRIKGKTWVNRWPVINVSNGTVTTDETGLITVNATPESTLYAIAQAKGIAANKSYTLTASNVSNASNSTWIVYVEEYDVDDTYVAAHSLISSTPTITFTTAANCVRIACMIVVFAGYSANFTTRVMLVDGTEAPDCFTPPASITSVETGKLVTVGKNLMPEDPLGINDSYQDCVYLDCGVLPPGDYVLSFENVTAWWETSSNADRIYIAGKYTTGIPSVLMSNTTIGQRAYGIFTNPHTQRVVFTDFSDDIFSNQSDFMLELGSTATAYEPPTVTTTPLPEVELRSLPNGTCDELVIKADGTCEVERNTVKVTFDGSEDEGWVRYTPNTSVFVGACLNFFADSPINATNTATAETAVVCRELPVIRGGFDQSVPCVAASYLSPKNLYITAPSTVTDIDSFNKWLAANPITCVVNVNGKPNEPQSPVTLPALPAPTFNQYHDSAVPSDTSTQYARDINIVLATLEAKVSELTVNQATS